MTKGICGKNDVVFLELINISELIIDIIRYYQIFDFYQVYSYY